MGDGVVGEEGGTSKAINDFYLVNRVNRRG